MKSLNQFANGGDFVLVKFRFKNYRSFRDEAILTTDRLPAVAIYGKNGGGKSNVVRAFWVAAQFIRSAQRTQHDEAVVPVTPFALNDYSKDEPTEFGFEYISDGIRYWYSFAATREKVVSESLYYAPHGRKALIFERVGQDFTFRNQKTKRTLIAKMVAANQLFFSMACTVSDEQCIAAMHWFRDQIFFPKDYPDISPVVIEHQEDKNMLRAISYYLKTADLGIQDVSFVVNGRTIRDGDHISDDVKAALDKFMRVLPGGSGNGTHRVAVSTIHQGLDRDGNEVLYSMNLLNESDGVRKLAVIAPAVESALRTGGTVVIDDLDCGLHPVLVSYLVDKFANADGAQIIFTTNDVDLMNELRNDQIYLVDKNKGDGASELYAMSDFSLRNAENIRKGYLAGKYGAIPFLSYEVI